MRRKLKPDTRPRWNDPNLKIRFRGKEYTAEEWSKECENALYDFLPNWRDDKTYDLKRKPKKL